MNKFDQIIKNITEDVSGSGIMVNPKQVSADFKKMISSATPATKAAIQALAEPMEKSTETDPDADLIKKLEELDFDKMPNDKKEKFIQALISKKIPLKTDEEQKTSTDQNQQTTSPTSYGV